MSAATAGSGLGGERSISAVTILVTLGGLLAALGAASGVDSIVWYVFSIVDQIDNDPWSILKPVYNPPPMYTHAYRPLSTAIIKLGDAAFGREIWGLRLHTFTHGLFLIGYGLAARRCLIAHGFAGRVALLAAATAMATPTILFSAWTIPEFDVVGGMVVLMAASELRSGRTRRALPWLALAILTKETTAVIMAAWLFVRAVSAFRARRSKAEAGLLVAYVVALTAAVWPILTVTPQVSHPFSVVHDDFALSHAAWLAFHNAGQVLYVAGPVGALLLGLLGVQRSRHARYAPALVVVALAQLVTGPLVRHYNHYESIIFSNEVWVFGWAVVAGMGILAITRHGRPDEARLALVISAGFLGLLAGPLLASFSRADLSARLLAPLIPLLHALAFRGAALLRSRHGWQNAAGLALGACIVWHSGAGAFNAVQSIHARFPLETNAKLGLLTALQPNCPWVYYTNRDQELAIEELALLGRLDATQLSCVRLIQLDGTSLGSGDLWSQEWRLQGYDHERTPDHSQEVTDALSRGRPSPVPVHLYVQLARSRMTPEQNELISPDFEWATSHLPETRPGVFDQAMGMTTVVDTPLERTFERLAHSRARWRAGYVQLPMWLHEVPKRLVLGLPMIEPWDYQATLYTVVEGAPLPGSAP